MGPIDQKALLNINAQRVFERIMRCPFCMGGEAVCRGGHDEQIREALRAYQAGHQDRDTGSARDTRESFPSS